MKCISLLQPWASLVAIGAKRIETRSWSTNYRGPLAIHASARFPRDARALCETPPFRFAFRTRPAGPLPRGRVLAIVQLAQVPPTADLIDQAEFDFVSNAALLGEFHFGDFTAGRFAWLLSDLRPLPEPVPAKGALGLWEWEEASAK